MRRMRTQPHPRRRTLRRLGLDRARGRQALAQSRGRPACRAGARPREGMGRGAARLHADPRRVGGDRSRPGSALERRIRIRRRRRRSARRQRTRSTASARSRSSSRASPCCSSATRASSTWRTPSENTSPWFRLKKSEGEGDVSVEGLLTHASGIPRESDFPYWSAPDFKFPTREEIVERVGSQEALYEPESRFQYSNLGITLAGELVAATSGMSYDALRAEPRPRAARPPRHDDGHARGGARKAARNRLHGALPGRDAEGDALLYRSRHRAGGGLRLDSRRSRPVRLLAVPAAGEGRNGGPEGDVAEGNAAGPLGRARLRDALGARVRGLERRREGLRRARRELPRVPLAPPDSAARTRSPRVVMVERAGGRHGAVGAAPLRHRRARGAGCREGAGQGEEVRRDAAPLRRALTTCSRGPARRWSSRGRTASRCSSFRR